MAVTPKPAIAHFPLILISSVSLSCLAAFPLWLALFSERLWALNKVLRCKQALHARPILLHGLFHGDIQPREGGLLGEPHAERRTLQNLIGPAPGRYPPFFGRAPFVDPA